MTANMLFINRLFCLTGWLSLFFISVNAQVIPNQGVWTPVGDVSLTTVFSDANNTDGVADGAIFVDGQSPVVGQGATFTFNGQMANNESFTLQTYTYNVNSSYVRYNVQLFNQTDNAVLDTQQETISGGITTPVLTTLTYTASSSDVGDVLQLRYIRTDDGNTARNFVIDNAKLNGSFVPIEPTTSTQDCPFTLNPDIPLVPSTPTNEAEIDLIFNKYSNLYLGTSAPATSALNSAISQYNNLNINVAGGNISGNQLTSFNNVSFLKTFSQHLKHNPADAAVGQMAARTIWLASKQFCDGSLGKDGTLYAYRNFARPAIFLEEVLTLNQKKLFEYTLYKHADDLIAFWEPNYDIPFQIANDAIDTDEIYNISDVLMGFATWQDTPEKRLQYMRGFQRYLERFFSYSSGTANGIKQDGSGFHHWTAYEQYMYAYNTAMQDLYYLSDTDFQIAPAHYLIFRDAVLAHLLKANDSNVRALSVCGRVPQGRTSNITQGNLKLMAIAGGKILNLSTADPVMASLYNRRYGIDAAFNYPTVGTFNEGFYQYNHASASAYRKDNWIAYNKGFSSNMWGTETYTGSNRYGRYQSYGALEIIYPGNLQTGNGFNVETWDWNFNPGTTSILLSFQELHAERGRLDELQQKRFVGALTFQNQGSDWLTNNLGDYGMFAMDFQQLEGNGFGVVHGPETHNETFTFKKSSFYFDDFIVCLGSGISNNDGNSSTITTLYQRQYSSGAEVVVNNATKAGTGTSSYSGAVDNWVLSNYNTGFYVVQGAHTIKIKKAIQQTPNHNQTNPGDLVNNPTATYCTGYIDHGFAPANDSYEYVIKPASNSTEMQLLQTDFQNNQKPYTVHQQNGLAHVVEYPAEGIWGYAFFAAAANLSCDELKGVDGSCLVMHQYDAVANEMTLALTNPDVGFESRSYAPGPSKTIEVTLQGEWQLANTYPNVTLISADQTATVVSFNVVDGLANEVILNKALNTFDLQVNIFLEGGFDPATGDMSKSNLKNMGILPGQTPVNPLFTVTPAGQPYQAAPWNYTGIEGADWDDSNYPEGTVDWVFVSLRKSPTKVDEYFRGVGLVMEDGQVNLITPLQGDVSLIDNSYVMISHRNHLKVISPIPATLDSQQEKLVYDFTTQDSYTDTGFGQKELAPNVWGMHAGDLLQSTGAGDINSNDKSQWSLQNGLFGLYDSADLDFDGDISATDNLLWFFNNGIFSTLED